LLLREKVFNSREKERGLLSTKKRGGGLRKNPTSSKEERAIPQKVRSKSHQGALLSRGQMPERGRRTLANYMHGGFRTSGRTIGASAEISGREGG